MVSMSCSLWALMYFSQIATVSILPAKRDVLTPSVISNPIATGVEIDSLAGVFAQENISNDIADSNIIFFILN